MGRTHDKVELRLQRGRSHTELWSDGQKTETALRPIGGKAESKVQ